MDTLPFELHAQIFEYACTDDGSTARALSLVSRYVRDVTSGFLYQSLVISGMDQMTELVARLDALPPYRRRIRHLFLSDWTSADVHKPMLTTSAVAMERYDAERALATRILDLAAPTLETLALVVSCPYSAPPLFGHLFNTLTLPHLASLSLHGFYPFPRTARALPRLERLHLSGNRNPHGLLQLGALEAACPSLSHLRISDLAMATSFARELHAAALPEESCDSSSPIPTPFASALPPALRHVAVAVRRPTALGVSKPTRGAQSAQEKMMAVLREIELRSAESRLETFVVEEAQAQEEGCEMHMYDVLRVEWLRTLGSCTGRSEAEAEVYTS